jgi:hypothetical protein
VGDTRPHASMAFHMQPDLVWGYLGVLSRSIGKERYRHQPVTEPHSDLIGWEGFVFNPVARVLDKLPDFGWNSIGPDADVTHR